MALLSVSHLCRCGAWAAAGFLCVCVFVDCCTCSLPLGALPRRLTAAGFLRCGGRGPLACVGPGVAIEAEQSQRRARMTAEPPEVPRGAADAAVQAIEVPARDPDPGGW
ncbi:uncharacterized protein Tco025E_09896, partial [Trypanosoma conorhini]